MIYTQASYTVPTPTTTPAASTAAGTTRRVRFASDSAAVAAAPPVPVLDQRGVSPLYDELATAPAPPGLQIPTSQPTATAIRSGSGNGNGTQEANLRAQVQVLEQEVKLLREGLAQTSGAKAAVGRTGSSHPVRPQLALGQRIAPARSTNRARSRSGGASPTDMRSGKGSATPVTGRPAVPSTAMRAHQDIPLQGSAQGGYLLPSATIGPQPTVALDTLASSATTAAGSSYWRSAIGLYQPPIAKPTAPPTPVPVVVSPAGASVNALTAPVQAERSPDRSILSLPQPLTGTQASSAPAIQVCMSDDHYTIPPPISVPAVPTQLSQSQPQRQLPTPLVVTPSFGSPIDGCAPPVTSASVTQTVCPPPVVPSATPATHSVELSSDSLRLGVAPALDGYVVPTDVSALQHELLLHQRIVQQQHATIHTLSQRLLAWESVACQQQKVATPDSRVSAMQILTAHLLNSQQQVAQLKGQQEGLEALVKRRTEELADAQRSLQLLHTRLASPTQSTAVWDLPATNNAQQAPPVVPPLTPLPVMPVPTASETATGQYGDGVASALRVDVPSEPRPATVTCSPAAPSCTCGLQQEAEVLRTRVKAWEAWFKRQQGGDSMKPANSLDQCRRRSDEHRALTRRAWTATDDPTTGEPSGTMARHSTPSAAPNGQLDSVRCIHDRPAPYTSELVLGGRPLPPEPMDSAPAATDRGTTTNGDTKESTAAPTIRRYCTLYDEITSPLSYLHPCHHPPRPIGSGSNGAAMHEYHPTALGPASRKRGTLYAGCVDQEMIEFLAKESVLREMATREREEVEKHLQAVLRRHADLSSEESSAEPETSASPPPAALSPKTPLALDRRTVPAATPFT